MQAVMSRLSRLLDRVPDRAWILLGCCLVSVVGDFEMDGVKPMNETREQLWQGVLKSRKDRMKKLIEHNAPDAFIYNEARLLLISETRNRKWAAIWKWTTIELKSKWSYTCFDIRRWWLKYWHGWPEPCAIGLAAGEEQSQHKKQGCKCEESFEQELIAAFRREQV